MKRLKTPYHGLRGIDWDRLAFRFMKGGAGFAIVYLIGWACYGDVAPLWLLVATAIVGLIVGILVFIVNPQVNGVDY